MQCRTAGKTGPPRKTRKPWEAWPPGNSRTNGNKGRSGSTGECGTTRTKRPPGREGSERRTGKVDFCSLFHSSSCWKENQRRPNSDIEMHSRRISTTEGHMVKEQIITSGWASRHWTSNALVIKKVKPEDTGIYSCSAENMLGSVNASAQLTVQCKCHECSILKQATN